MGKYNVHAGHCPAGGTGSGAAGLLIESTEARKVKDNLIAILRGSGHTVHDCTVNTNMSQSACLTEIVKMCNAHSVDLDISIHLNAGGGTGTEVLYYSDSMQATAASISAQVAAALGIKDRGAKKRTDLAVLKNTKAKAVLVECAFVDNQTDKNNWDIGKCAAAIAAAVTGSENVVTQSPAPAPVPVPSTNNNSGNTATGWVGRLQTEINKQGFGSLKVDNIAGSKTLGACPIVKKGAKGNITKLIQEKLISLGISCGNAGADGDFGTNTEKAVKEFQKRKGLKQDGIVGQKTWKALLGL